jgi:hypothetical protein
VVRDRLKRWRQGEYHALWDEAVKLTKPAPSRRRKQGQGEATGGGQEKTQQQRNGERAAMLAQEGEYSRALKALTSAGMAEQTRDSVAAMKAKHPPATEELGPLPETDVAPLIFSQLEVHKAVQRFRRGSAPGPSGLRPEHVKSALKAAPGRRDRTLQSLTRLANIMAAGGVPEVVAPFLCGARLHGALKKDGDLRPIAVGNLLRRIVAKCAASRRLCSPHISWELVCGGGRRLLCTWCGRCWPWPPRNG